MWDEIYPILLLDILFYFDKKCVAFTKMGKTAWIGYQNHRRHSKTEKKLFLTLTR